MQIRSPCAPGVAVDPKTNTIYVARFGPVLIAGTVLVISGQTNTVSTTIHVGAGPVGVAVDPKAETVYVTNADDGTVAVISAPTDTVTATIPVGTFAQPTGVAVNPKTGTAYVADTATNTVSVLAPCPK